MDETIDMWGTESSLNFGTIDVMVIPCNVMETELGGKKDKIPENCNRDKTELAKYLSNSYNLVTY